MGCMGATAHTPEASGLSDWGVFSHTAFTQLSYDGISISSFFLFPVFGRRRATQRIARRFVPQGSGISEGGAKEPHVYG